jgi:hypothetical protein
MTKPNSKKMHNRELLSINGARTYDNDEEGREKSITNLPSNLSRRSFLRKARDLTAIALASAAVPLEPMLGGKESQAEAAVVPYGSAARTAGSLNYRETAAANEEIDIGVLPDNGDAARFTDFSGSWSKGLKHTSLAIVDPASYNSLINALTTGTFQDFENIIVGNPGGGKSPLGRTVSATLNGPQGCLAFDLEGRDSHATKIPPAPSVTSARTADEEVECYWGALLRDTPFIEYTRSPLAAQAATELTALTYISSSSNNEYPFPVTPQNLFRGQIIRGDGCVQGPYVSQFMLQPTFFGAQSMTQQMRTFLPGQNFMTNVDEFQSVENGFPPSASLAFCRTFLFIHAGLDLAAFTHVDVLYQAYFVAALVLLGLGVPPNPGNPYVKSQTENGFVTLGAPDIVATMAEMATRALKAAWFHKWIVNLRQRPEEVGALVHARLANVTPVPQASLALHRDVLNSQAVAEVFSKFGTYLLPQAFPEGPPVHPCYPTGHGTVAGACVTALKFFFDCDQPIRPLLLAAGTDVVESNADGTALVPYRGSDADELTINGELVKLAFNVTFGHGIHAGIHFRSSSRESILLGEQVALSVLQDRANGYNEPFDINITKFHGTIATISNPGNVAT